MALFDAWDSATLTDLVVRPITTMFEDQPRLGDVLAPYINVTGFEVKVRSRGTLAFGKGQFRSLDATPALFKPQHRMEEALIGLAHLDEMSRVSESQYIRLNSSDENIRLEAGVDLVDLGTMMTLRNERLSEWMRWQAFLTGTLLIEYPSGQQRFIDYGIPSTNRILVSVLWSDVTNADPVADIRGAANSLAANSGHYGLHLHMASETYDYLIENAKIRALLTGFNRGMIIPTEEDVLRQLRAGTEFILYDDGYRDVDAQDSVGIPGSLTRYLPPGKVLMTTDYQIDGQRIADTLNGDVMIAAGFNQAAITKGPVSETMFDTLSKNHFYRQASTRLPRLNRPDAFVIMQVA